MPRPEDLDELITSLVTEQRLRGMVIQGAHMQRSYNEWVASGCPEDGPGDPQLQHVFQCGITYVLGLLGKTYLDAGTWYAADGSESVEGDVLGTIGNIFEAAGFVTDDGDPMSGDELKALLPDRSNVVRLADQKGAE